MKFKKAIFFGYSEETLGPDYWARIDKVCESKVLLPKDSPDLKRHLSGADCLVVNQGMVVDKNMIDQAPGLKYVAILATGYNRIDAAYAAQKGVTVCNVPGYAIEGVAEFVFGALIDHLRELERAKVQARGGDYSELTFTGTEIKGKNFAVVGLGRIGRRVAKIAKLGFGASVSYWSRNRKPDAEKLSIQYQELESLVKMADIISLHLSFAPETEGLFDAKLIDQIKPGAVMVNFAPMELVKIDDLARRLQKGDITFILDHSDELSPEQIKTLAPYKNCVLYPPIGFRTKEAAVAKQEIFVTNLENFLAGKPTNKVN